jgi:hypothetical protein
LPAIRFHVSVPQAGMLPLQEAEPLPNFSGGYSTVDKSPRKQDNHPSAQIHLQRFHIFSCLSLAQLIVSAERVY